MSCARSSETADIQNSCGMSDRSLQFPTQKNTYIKCRPRHPYGCDQKNIKFHAPYRKLFDCNKFLRIFESSVRHYTLPNPHASELESGSRHE